MENVDYATLTPEQAAKIARAETLKEVIVFCEKEMLQYETLAAKYIKEDAQKWGMAAACALTCQKNKEAVEQKLNAIQW